MIPSRFLKGFLAAFIVYVVGDVVWHNVILLDFYEQRFNDINGETIVNQFPLFIIVFEAIAAAVGTYFVLGMGKKGSVAEGALHGAMMGTMVITGINFVAHSLIPKWDLTMVAVDVPWGIVLSAIGGAAIVLAAGRKAA